MGKQKQGVSSSSYRPSKYPYGQEGGEQSKTEGRGVGGTGHPLTFSLSMPSYLARIRGSRTVARLVPVTVRRVPPLKEEERRQCPRPRSTRDRHSLSLYEQVVQGSARALLARINHLRKRPLSEPPCSTQERHSLASSGEWEVLLTPRRSPTC